MWCGSSTPSPYPYAYPCGCIHACKQTCRRTSTHTHIDMLTYIPSPACDHSCVHPCRPESSMSSDASSLHCGVPNMQRRQDEEPLVLDCANFIACQDPRIADWIAAPPPRISSSPPLSPSLCSSPASNPRPPPAFALLPFRPSVPPTACDGPSPCLWFSITTVLVCTCKRLGYPQLWTPAVHCVESQDATVRPVLREEEATFNTYQCLLSVQQDVQHLVGASLGLAPVPARINSDPPS